MTDHPPKHPWGRERRSAERHSCPPDTTCVVTDLLDQNEVEAAPCNAASGGACVVAEPHYPPGTRISIELRSPDDRSLVVFAEVRHALLIPSLREMWLTGCSFPDGPVTEEELRPFVEEEGFHGHAPEQ